MNSIDPHIPPIYRDAIYDRIGQAADYYSNTCPLNLKRLVRMHAQIRRWSTLTDKQRHRYV